MLIHANTLSFLKSLSLKSILFVVVEAKYLIHGLINNQNSIHASVTKNINEMRIH